MSSRSRAWRSAPLASAGDDRSIRVWDDVLWRSFGELRATVCRLVGSGLSTTEWALYAPAGISYGQGCS